ncbi:MAG: hypothetical protein WCG27_05020 [Pseudomonadota bacterium]
MIRRFIYQIYILRLNVGNVDYLITGLGQALACASGFGSAWPPRSLGQTSCLAFHGGLATGNTPQQSLTRFSSRDRPG